MKNFPGYPEGIGGPEMMIQLREQAERFGLEVQDKNVEKVDFSERPFKVWVEGEEFKSKSVIICTGAESIWLGAEGEEEQKVGELAHVQLVMAPSSENKRYW